VLKTLDSGPLCRLRQKECLDTADEKIQLVVNLYTQVPARNQRKRRGFIERTERNRVYRAKFVVSLHTQVPAGPRAARR
jgi:hypothetical protein